MIYIYFFMFCCFCFLMRSMLTKCQDSTSSGDRKCKLFITVKKKNTIKINVFIYHDLQCEQGYCAVFAHTDKFSLRKTSWNTDELRIHLGCMEMRNIQDGIYRNIIIVWGQKFRVFREQQTHSDFMMQRDGAPEWQWGIVFKMP